MVAGNPALFHYFLQDDIYLLKADKDLYAAEAGHIAGDAAEAENVMEATPPQPTSFNFLGDNKAAFLIVVDYPVEMHMAEAHLKALESTLGRKELRLDDVAILNLASYTNTTWDEICGFFVPQKLLVLGDTALPANLAKPKMNTIEKLENRLQLFTYNFTDMLADREKARAFWEQMKNL